MEEVGFEESLAATAEFLKPVAFSLTHNSEDAKDLYQETLFRALLNKEKFNGAQNVRAWLYVIMRNAFINHYRRKVKERVVAVGAPEDLPAGEYGFGYNEGPGMAELREFKTAIYGLPAHFKKAFLFYFDGYKYQEIATMMGEPLGTIKSRIHLARKILKKQAERQ